MDLFAFVALHLTLFSARVRLADSIIAASEALAFRCR